MRSQLRQGFYHLQELDDRAVYDVYAETIDPPPILGIGVDALLQRPLVIPFLPVRDQSPGLVERYALRPVGTRFLLRPARSFQPLLQIVERRLWYEDLDGVTSLFASGSESTRDLAMPAVIAGTAGITAMSWRMRRWLAAATSSVI
jgi:hypothetical protein